jgi:chromosome segregation ATPase
MTLVSAAYRRIEALETQLDQANTRTWDDLTTIKGLEAEKDRLEARLADLEAEARQLRADKGTLSAEVEQLRNLIGEAADEIADWGAYAAQYFREKHDLEGTVKRFRAIAKGPE